MSAGPQVEVLVDRPRGDAAAVLGLDAVVGGERVLVGLRARDPARRVAVRVLGGELELDVRIGDEARPRGGHAVLVRVGGAVVLVERLDLALDLLVGDVLLVGLVDHVHDDLQRDPLAPHSLGVARGDELLALVLDLAVAAAQVRVLLIEALVDLLCTTLTVFGRLRRAHGLAVSSRVQMGL